MDGNAGVPLCCEHLTRKCHFWRLIGAAKGLESLCGSPNGVHDVTDKTAMSTRLHAAGAFPSLWQAFESSKIRARDAWLQARKKGKG